MIRLFEQHKIRPIKEIDGLWNFTKENDDKVYRIPVPGCWEQHPDLNMYRGKGFFETTVYLRQDGDIKLEFKGVSHTGKVYFDDVYLGEHYNAFTPFSFIISEVTSGEHTIKVFVDNTFGEHSSLHVPNDYYTYGGITRPVSISHIPKTYIKSSNFTPYFNNDTNLWEAKIDVTIANNCATTSKKIVCQIHNTKLELDDIELLANSEKTVTLYSTFEDVESWSHTDPNLYFINTVLFDNDVAIDDLIDRVGFRIIETNGNHILLNNQKVVLKGFNRHEDSVVEGCAISLQNMILDMDLMQDMNVNAVRTSHYPNDERFLDLCDERGIMVWEENHARGYDLEKMQNPNFEKQCKDCIDEMIENHYNHPSIVIWGILNECASETEEGRRMYKTQFEQIKSLDTSRPTSFATCRHLNDICLDLPDIVSSNMYTRWGGEKDLTVIDRHNNELKWIQESGGANKPLIVSEFGAGAIYGYRDRRKTKWTEERQAIIIEETLQVYIDDERLSGIFIWQFADCRVTEEEWYGLRPRTYNNKGIVDEYRRPKLAYDVVKELFAKI